MKCHECGKKCSRMHSGRRVDFGSPSMEGFSGYDAGENNQGEIWLRKM